MSIYYSPQKTPPYGEVHLFLFDNPDEEKTSKNWL